MNHRAPFCSNRSGAKLHNPQAIAFGPDGTLYIADTNKNRIRAVTNGVIRTVAGTGGLGDPNDPGNGGPSTLASIHWPQGVAVSGRGEVYVSEGPVTMTDQANRVRVLDAAMAGIGSTDILLPSEDASEVYVFSAAGRHLATRHGLTGAYLETFSYDDDGLLETITDVAGNETTIHRDTNGEPLSIESPYGQFTELSLDANDYLGRVENPAEEATLFEYTPGGLMTKMTTPRGFDYNFTWDPLGRLFQDFDPAGGYKQLVRTDIGDTFAVELRTAMNRTTTYTLTQQGNGDEERLRDNPDGTGSSLEIEPSFRRTSVAADGTTVVRSYGPDPRFGMRAPVASTTTTFGTHTATTQATRSVTLSTTTDPFTVDLLTETLVVNGELYTTVADRDGSGNTFTLTTTTPETRATVTKLDSAGRVSRIELPGVLPTDLLYDVRGRLWSMIQGTRAWTFTYDTRGNLEAVRNPLLEVTEFEYDDAGRVERQILPGPGNRDIDFDYDASGNMTVLAPPGRPAHGFESTAVDLERLYAPPQPEPPLIDPRTYYEYNADRQLELVVRPDGGTIDYVYDPLSGRLTSQLLTTPDPPNPPTTLAYGYTYDPQTGELETITAPDGGTLAFDKTTDSGLLRKTTTWGGTSPVQGTVTQIYDADNRLVSEQVNQETPVTFGYDDDGLVISATLPGSTFTITREPATGRIESTQLGVVEDSYIYNTYGEVESYTATANGMPIFEVSYTRDALGRIATKTESVEQEPATTYGYTYDTPGRLSDVHTTTSQGTSHTAHYAYDENGNRIVGAAPATFNQEHGELLNAVHDDQDRLLEYDTAGNGETDLSYSANGEMIRTDNTLEGTTQFEYDHFGNLRRVEFPGPMEIEYLIDGQNRRIGRKVDGALEQGFFYRDQLAPIAELDSQGNVVAQFVYVMKSQSPAAMRRDGVNYRIITDHLGSARIVVDASSGTVADRIHYDEFGNRGGTSIALLPFGWAGGLQDATGPTSVPLIRFGARDYDPQIGRWASKDPIVFLGGDPNIYSYAGSDPINSTDASGLASTTANPLPGTLPPGAAGGCAEPTPAPCMPTQMCMVVCGCEGMVCSCSRSDECGNFEYLGLYVIPGNIPLLRVFSCEEFKPRPFPLLQPPDVG